MKVVEPGHIYELTSLDGDDEPVVIRFVNREDNPHPGTQTQEVLRAQIDSLEVLIDRTNHCDGCLPWTGNERIIKAMSEAQRQLRLALLFHEQRALERKVERDGMMPELIPVGKDGHFDIPNLWPPDITKCRSCGGDFLDREVVRAHKVGARYQSELVCPKRLEKVQQHQERERLRKSNEETLVRERNS